MKCKMQNKSVQLTQNNGESAEGFLKIIAFNKSDNYPNIARHE